MIKNNRFDGFINDMCENFREKNEAPQVQTEEDMFQEIIDSKLFFSSQEITTFDLNCSTKSIQNTSTGCEFKEINGWLQSCKTFQFLPDVNEHNVLGVPEDNFGVVTNPPFSPIKRHSEVTEGLRQVSNIKPIILCGGATKEVQLD